jgi:hypothetical protein
MRARPVVHDNIATPGAPVWRARIKTPLTPRAVRNELIKQSHSEGDAQGWLEARMTPLDRCLSDEQAEALEAYYDCEMKLNGVARGVDYTGDRVQSSRYDMSPISDEWQVRLARHSALKKRLSDVDTAMLALFIEQQEGKGPSDAMAALRFGLPARDKARAWVQALALVAGRLV